MVMAIIATMVVPAPHGCNLSCAGCIIDQRKEGGLYLSSQDYVRFLERILATRDVSQFAIQGYEPILPEIFSLTEELLCIAAKKTRTALVTNGVYLKEYASRLIRVADGIAISIDSHDANIHNSSRGKCGAWQATVDGIRALRATLVEGCEGDAIFTEYVDVNSILYPGKISRLRSMPELLVSLGLRKWIISPLINVKKCGYSGDLKIVYENLLELDMIARAHGVDMFLGDELRTMEGYEDLYEKLSIETIDDPSEMVFRLSPSGSIAWGKQILEQVDCLPKWDKVEDPSVFVSRTCEAYISSK